MKNKYFKHNLLLIFTLLMGCILTGCTDFDASRYVQSCLDASFHGEFDAYMEMTNSTEEAARSAYDNLIQSEIDALGDQYTVSDEQKEKFRGLFIDMYKACKYETGEAVKNDDDSFTVPVTCYKLTVFSGLNDAMDQYAADYYNQHSDASTEELYAAVLDFMYDYMNEKISTPEYGEPATTNVTVSLSSTSPKMYTLDTDDLQNLVYELLDIEDE